MTDFLIVEVRDLDAPQPCPEEDCGDVADQELIVHFEQGYAPLKRTLCYLHLTERLQAWSAQPWLLRGDA
jgi:hypothetical protein